MEPTINKSKFQIIEANDSFEEDNNMHRTSNSENVHVHNNDAIRNEIVNTSNESNMQLKSLVTEIYNHVEEFLCFSKSSLQINENSHESDRISNNGISFSINEDMSNKQ